MNSKPLDIWIRLLLLGNSILIFILVCKISKLEEENKFLKDQVKQLYKEYPLELERRI